MPRSAERITCICGTCNTPFSLTKGEHDARLKLSKTKILYCGRPCASAGSAKLGFVKGSPMPTKKTAKPRTRA